MESLLSASGVRGRGSPGGARVGACGARGKRSDRVVTEGRPGCQNVTLGDRGHRERVGLCGTKMSCGARSAGSGVGGAAQSCGERAARSPFLSRKNHAGNELQRGSPLRRTPRAGDSRDAPAVAEGQGQPGRSAPRRAALPWGPPPGQPTRVPAASAERAAASNGRGSARRAVPRPTWHGGVAPVSLRAAGGALPWCPAAGGVDFKSSQPMGSGRGRVTLRGRV